jgi:leucyl aminopeptidase (aminopeptidase T)
MRRVIRSWILVLAGSVLLAASASSDDHGEKSGREDLARRLVTESARVREGELVQLAGCPEDIPLLEDLAVAVRRQGAHPLITLGSDRLSRRLFEDVPARFDSQPAAFDLKLAGLIDARIQTEFADDDALAGIPAERVEAVARGNREVYALLRKRKVRLVWLGNGLYPTAARARQAKLSQAVLRQLFQAGLAADRASMHATGERLQKILAGAKIARLTSLQGTDLSFGVAGRPVTVSDGIADVKSGDAPPWTWLPAGEVYCVPVAGTAEGRIVLDRYLFEGKTVEGLSLTIKAGKLTDLQAKSGGEALQAAYKAAEPGKELLSSVDIGINPNVQLPAGCLLQTNVPSGMVTVGLGNNTWAGGDVKIPFALPLYIGDGTLTVDGQVVVEKGVLKR